MRLIAYESDNENDALSQSEFMPVPTEEQRTGRYLILHSSICMHMFRAEESCRLSSN